MMTTEELILTFREGHITGTELSIHLMARAHNLDFDQILSQPDIGPAFRNDLENTDLDAEWHYVLGSGSRARQKYPPEALQAIRDWRMKQELKTWPPSTPEEIQKAAQELLMEGAKAEGREPNPVEYLQKAMHALDAQSIERARVYIALALLLLTAQQVSSKTEVR